MLLVPGRIGTSSPSLVFPLFSPTSAVLISYAKYPRAKPDICLSFPTEVIFQDLVEAGILYGAVFKEWKTITFEPEKIRRRETNWRIFAEGKRLRDIIGIYCVSDRESLVYHDMRDEHLLCIL